MEFWCWVDFKMATIQKKSSRWNAKTMVSKQVAIGQGFLMICQLYDLDLQHFMYQKKQCHVMTYEIIIIWQIRCKCFDLFLGWAYNFFLLLFLFIKIFFLSPAITSIHFSHSATMDIQTGILIEILKQFWNNSAVDHRCISDRNFCWTQGIGHYSWQSEFWLKCQ